MKDVHRKTRAGLLVISAASVAVVACLLAACTQAGPAPSGKYVLTIQNNVNCTTVPSGAVMVNPGAATATTAKANVGHTWSLANGWTVVSGTASIADPSQSATTVTLSAGDATILATCP